MAKAEQTMEFDVSAADYMKAVLDYDSYPNFVLGCKSVENKAIGPNHHEVKYNVSLMKDLWYRLEHKANPEEGTMTWKLIDSDLLKANEGNWKIEALGEKKCKVRYTIDIEFKISVPGFILSSLVKGSLPALLKGFFDHVRK